MYPAIKTARENIFVIEEIVHTMESAVRDGEYFLPKNPTSAFGFAPNGILLGLGDTKTRHWYADTSEALADQGPDALYTGRDYAQRHQG